MRSESAPTLSQRLAAYVCAMSFDDLPVAVVEKVKTVLLHDLAVTIAGSGAEESTRALAFARGDAGSSGRCTITGVGLGASPLDATFVNAVMMRALRQEDTILPSMIHPGPLLIPAALALAEQYGSSGRDVVAAIVAGYQVLATVATPLSGSGPAGDGAQPMARTPSHVYGAFGTATVGARLIGLDQEQTATAMAYAGNLAAMITMGFENHQYGLVARNGLTAVYLGAAGAPARDDALGGEIGFFAAQTPHGPGDIDARLETISSPFAVMTSILKPYPCTAANLVPVRLLERLRLEHGLDADGITAITVARSPVFGYQPAINSKGPWPSVSWCISSLPFALAAVQLDGLVRATRFEDPHDPVMLHHAQKVEIQPAPFTNLSRHRVEVRTRDGRLLVAEGDEHALEPPDPRAWIERYAAPVIGDEKAVRLADVVGRIDELASVDELTACLIP